MDRILNFLIGCFGLMYAWTGSDHLGNVALRYTYRLFLIACFVFSVLLTARVIDL